MILKCKACGSTNTCTVSKKELGQLLHQTSPVAGCGVGAMLSPEIIAALIVASGPIIATVTNHVLKKKRDNDEKILVCKDCGNYEKL